MFIKRKIVELRGDVNKKLPISVLFFRLWIAKREPSLGRLLQNSEAENLSQAWLG